jgi:condensin complex subunit 2
VDSNTPLTDPSEARQFSQVITGLQKTYPKDKMDEISTSFCFICLLHLANEQGLKLESSVKEEDGATMDTEDVMKERVGDIWDIKVGCSFESFVQTVINVLSQIFRDPTATPAA